MTGEEYAQRVIDLLKIEDPYGTTRNMLVAAFNFGQVEGLREGRQVLDQLNRQIQTNAASTAS